MISARFVDGTESQSPHSPGDAPLHGYVSCRQGSKRVRQERRRGTHGRPRMAPGQKAVARLCLSVSPAFLGGWPAGPGGGAGRPQRAPGKARARRVGSSSSVESRIGTCRRTSRSATPPAPSSSCRAGSCISGGRTCTTWLGFPWPIIRLRDGCAVSPDRFPPRRKNKSATPTGS